MPHIHTEPNQIDFCVDVYVVFQEKVLLRFHDKHAMWLPPGGHIELDETPQHAAIREVKEEVGLDVELWKGLNLPQIPDTEHREYRELIPPMFMNIHRINPEHRHLSMIYFATCKTNIIIEPNTHEKSGGCRWLTSQEVLADQDINYSIKVYALSALEMVR